MMVVMMTGRVELTKIVVMVMVSNQLQQSISVPLGFAASGSLTPS